MEEISYKDLKFNPFNLIGGEWMLITAGDNQNCNTMTASWGHLGCLWGNNDPSAVVYIRFQDGSHRTAMLHSILYIVLCPDATTYQRYGKRHPLDGALRIGKDLSVWRSDHSGRRGI